MTTRAISPRRLPAKRRQRDLTIAEIVKYRDAGTSDALAGLPFCREYDGWLPRAQESYECGRLGAFGAWGPVAQTGAAQ